MKFEIMNKKHVTYGVMTLICLTAFALVYVKDLNRRLFVQLQQLEQVGNEQSMQWSRLLLEKSAWSSPARIQNMAQKTLGMILPKPKDIQLIILNTSDASSPAA